MGGTLVQQASVLAFPTLQSVSVKVTPIYATRRDRLVFFKGGKYAKSHNTDRCRDCFRASAAGCTAGYCRWRWTPIYRACLLCFRWHTVLYTFGREAKTGGCEQVTA